MRWLRGAYRRRFGRHGRFHLAVVLTIAVACYILVPPVVAFLDAMMGYNPDYYEPKDEERLAWEESRRGPARFLTALSWQALVNIALFVVVAVVWLSLMPARSPRRRAGSR
jgi:hypothetical protein